MAAPAISTPELDLVHPETYVKHGYPHDIWTQLRREAPVSWIENELTRTSLKLHLRYSWPASSRARK